MREISKKNAELVAAYQEAKREGRKDEARRLAGEVLAANEGLVKKFGMLYGKPQTGEEKEDAFQAARFGILRALEDYDAEKSSFGTHAQWHIRDYVQRWTGKTIAVVRPRSAQMPASVARKMREHRLRFGRDLTAEELGITQAKLDEWMSASLFVELDSYTDEDRPFELSYEGEDAFQAARLCEFEKKWESVTESLSERNLEIAQRVLVHGHTSVDVARDFGLSHGAVLQICKRVEVRVRRAFDPQAVPVEGDWDAKTRVRARRHKTLRKTRTAVA